MKYIFVAGAPGSKWSSVVKNIYFSPDIDQSDYTEQRTYYHDAGGSMDLMHLGAYFDPGMEFGRWFDRLHYHSKEECEAEFDRPFSGQGIKIIKSHVFANQVDVLKRRWPDCPVILVHRPDDACLGWWVKCGEFGITYPDYHGYYNNLKTMASIITHQNEGIERAKRSWPRRTPANNLMLCDMLGLKFPPERYAQDYTTSDVEVSIL
jgi:hypothetical protein